MVIFIGLVKNTHPAHVAWGKACAVRELCLQEFCGCDRRALLRALADDLADGINFVHLRKIPCKNCGQFPVHRAVIYRFSDVHSLSFPRWRASFLLFRWSIASTLRMERHSASLNKTRLSINALEKRVLLKLLL